MPLPLNQILSGDCIEQLRTLPDNCVDLVFADPPYNLQLQGELTRPNQTVVDAVNDDWDKFDDLAAYDAFTRAWLQECQRVLKATGTLWVIGSYHNIFRVGAAMMDGGFWLLNDVIWHKTNPMPNFRGTRFTNATETLIWAQPGKGRGKYTFNYHAAKHLNDDKQMPNVWEIPLCTGAERIKVDGKKAHSTQKPEALLYRVILSSSNVGDVVLDPFFGTGTTGAVAKKLRRQFIGIERDPFYIQIARERIDALAPPDPALPETLFATESRRNLARVSFPSLVEAGYLSVGQTLFSRDRTQCGVVTADGRVCAAGDPSPFTGSIHQTAARTYPGANGWDFWFYDTDDGLVSIDALRTLARQASRDAS